MSTCDIEIIELPVVSSTNDYLKELAKNGVKAPLVVIAEEQTGGKGTKNRSFISKKGGIYLSILINSKSSGFDATLITPMTAVAVCDSVEQISENEADIKWVNDVYIKGKKVAGILCESVILPNGEMPYIIVGIGINLFKPLGGFDKEIKGIATSVFEQENNSVKQRFIKLLLNNFFNYYQSLDNKTFLEKYRSKNIVLGKTVNVLFDGVLTNAKALDIDDSCRLVVEFEDKTKKALSSGEVFIEV